MELRNIFVRTSCRTYCFQDITTAEQVKQRVQQLEGLACELQNLYLNARRLDGDLSGVEAGSTLRVLTTLKGGKGGFGAKLKNQGSKKVRSNNNIHSRDLSGRRIKNVNLEKEYIESYKKKLQEDKIVKEEREKFKLRENTLYEEHAFMRLDKNYTTELENGEKNIEDAVKKGFMSNWRKAYAKQTKPTEAPEKQACEQGNAAAQELPKPVSLENPSQEKGSEQTLKRPRVEATGEELRQAQEQCLNEQPRKILKATPEQRLRVCMDKSAAEKTVQELLSKPVEESISSMSSAASKLKSLFKR